MQRRISRIGISMVAAAAIMTTGAACSSGDADTSGDAAVDKSTKVIIGDQVKVTQSLLDASGELEDAPYTVEWASFEAGPPLLEAASAGKIDFGGVGDVPPVFSQSAGGPLKIVATLNKPHANDYLLVKPDSPIKQVSDLKGKKVAFTKGSSSHGFVLAALKKEGLAPSDITETFLTPTEALSAFTQGDVDAWAVWNPYAVVAQGQGAQVIADSEGLTTQQNYWLASDKALADPKKAAAIKDLVARLARAQKWSIDNKDTWVPIYSKLTTLPEEVAAKTFDAGAGVFIPIDDEVIAKQQTLLDLFSEAGVIPNKPVAAEYFDDRYNADIETAAQP